MLLFIVFPLSLNLNNTSTSLANGYYLKFLKWNTMNIKWKFYVRTCLVFQKKNWFSWLVFIHVRTKSCFSIQFLHVMVSIGFHYENQIKN
jgi:hypothetical protein